MSQSRAATRLSWTFKVRDLARCVKLYLNREPITGRFFDAKPGSYLEESEVEANRDPVVRLLDMERETLTP